MNNNLKIGDVIRILNTKGFNKEMIEGWRKEPTQIIKGVNRTRQEKVNILFSDTGGGYWSYFSEQLEVVNILNAIPYCDWGRKQ